MDLKRLHHLVTLSEERNFSRAAERCHISQSALSRSVQTAEDELGLKLFDRGTTAVTCTDAGAFVIDRARKLLFDNQCMLRDVKMYRERKVGDLAFGTGPYPAACMVPALLTEIRRQHPGVNVRVEVNNAIYLADHLRAETLDFYVADLRNVQASPEFTIAPIGTIEAALYVRPSHPLLSLQPVRLVQVMRYGLASAHAPPGVLEMLGQFAGLPDGVSLPLAVECDNLHLLCTLALATDTVACCPVESSNSPPSVAAGLVRLSIADVPPLYAEMAVVSLTGRSFSLMAELAVSFMSQYQYASNEPLAL